MKKILVLCGGFSAEREVSLISGREAAKALQSCGYDVVMHDLQSAACFWQVLQKEKPAAVFNALHGNWGEDGTIQGFLDLLQIPYTHSGMKASVIGMDKSLTKKICRENGIKTAPGEEMSFTRFKTAGSRMAFPYVVKPCQEGSSVGVFIVRNEEERRAVKYENENRRLLIERFIPGLELTVAVVDGRACGVTELAPEGGFYDYRCKYTAGLTRHILPARIPEAAAKTARKYAEKLHCLLGCRLISRTDLRYNEQDGAVVLEINTHPGLTPLSLVPEQAAYAGIPYAELCRRLVENAACRSLRENER